MAKSYEAYGKIVKIGERVVINEKLTKREFWLYQVESWEGNTYENWIPFTLLNRNCDMLDSWGVDDFVKVTFKIAGKPYKKDEPGAEERLFANNTAWKIENGKAPRGQNGQQGNGQQGNGQPRQQNNNAGQPGAGNNAPNFYNPSPENVDDCHFKINQ